ncbi:MAG: hypothetical protein JWO03_896 [Bacteroidetes bacterium]|nr:hypothetical protein [Bacteroidota bacterium]
MRQADQNTEWQSAQAERMEIVMSKMKWNQEKLGGILGMTQAGASKIARGKTKLSNSHVRKIHEASGYHKKWLLSGDGPMKDGPTEVNEPTIMKSKVKFDISEGAIRERFNKAIDEIKKQRGYEHYTQVSEALHLNNDHLTAVRTGQKLVTLTQITHLTRYGDGDASYVVSNKGSMMLSTGTDTVGEMAALQRRITELENDKKNLQLLVDTYSGEKRQTG